MMETNDILLRDSFDVELVQWTGSDQFICDTARVSTLGTESVGTEESAGLINYLMRNKHGSPFEHGLMTFRIFAPIFVWREFMRHRIGFSYNEQSGRYMKLAAVFYMANGNRGLVQVGKQGNYELVQGTEAQREAVQEACMWSYRVAWDCYSAMLEEGIANEVARNVLPVATYSAAYVTCNPRSLMSFLSLRTQDDRATNPSKPLWEINQVANAMEDVFAKIWPITYQAYLKNGRVAP